MASRGIPASPAPIVPCGLLEYGLREGVEERRELRGLRFCGGSAEWRAEVEKSPVCPCLAGHIAVATHLLEGKVVPWHLSAFPLLRQRRRVAAAALSIMSVFLCPFGPLWGRVVIVEVVGGIEDANR